MAARNGFSIDIGYVGLSLLAGVAAYLAARAKHRQALTARPAAAVDVVADERVRVLHACGREWEVWMQEKGCNEDGYQEE